MIIKPPLIANSFIRNLAEWPLRIHMSLGQTIQDYFSIKKFTYQGRGYKNHNKLLTSYEGVDGIKTGYIRAAGYNLVASAKRSKQRLIGVVFGGNSSKHRNRHMTKLLNKGFANKGVPTLSHSAY